MATLNEVKQLVRNNPGNLNGDFYRINGGDSVYLLRYSPEWDNAVAEATGTPFQDGGGFFFWSDGDHTYTPSPLAADILAGRANKADYITGFDFIPSYSTAYGDPNWSGGGLGGALFAAAGIAALAFGGFGMAGALAPEGAAISAADAAAAMGSGVDAAGWASVAEETAAVATATTTETSMGLADSIGDFGDWIQTDTGTMYNPQTGEYLTPDGFYNAGSTGGTSSPTVVDSINFWGDASQFRSGATLSSSVNDIFGKVSDSLKGLTKVLNSAAGTVQATRNNLGQLNQPNYAAQIGSANLGKIALAAAAFFALKG